MNISIRFFFKIFLKVLLFLLILEIELNYFNCRHKDITAKCLIKTKFIIMLKCNRKLSLCFRILTRIRDWEKEKEKKKKKHQPANTLSYFVMPKNLLKLGFGFYNFYFIFLHPTLLLLSLILVYLLLD